MGYSCECPSIPDQGTYTVHSLLLSVQPHCCLDEPAVWVDGEVFPVFVPCASFEEGVLHSSIETLVLICGIDFIHVGSERDFLFADTNIVSPGEAFKDTSLEAPIGELYVL